MTAARALSFAAALGLAAALAGAPALAQPYPSSRSDHRAAGGGGLADTLARIVAQRLGERRASPSWWRTGRAARARSAPVRRAPADGYTLFMGSLGTCPVLAHLTRTPVRSGQDLVRSPTWRRFPTCWW
jgi:hypothetical protein